VLPVDENFKDVYMVVFGVFGVCSILAQMEQIIEK
jgi:hypothetical protein